jgi:hypothetical protein
MIEPSDALRSLSNEAQDAGYGLLSALLSVIADIPLHEPDVRADMQARLMVARNEPTGTRSPTELRILDRAILALR